MIIINNTTLFLVSVSIIIVLFLIYKLAQSRKEAEWQAKLQKLRSEIADKQRASIKGNVTEMFAPYLQDFPFKASECKFLGDPIDYVVFEGLDNKDITAIHFLDIKVDTSQLKKHQKQVKDIIEEAGSSKLGFTTFRFKTDR